MHNIFVYGSLRVGEYNFNAFQTHYNINPIKTNVKLKGYKLFSLGQYPGIIEDLNSTIIGDILQVNEECYKHIHKMEINANYIEKEIKIKELICKIYIYEGNTTNEVIHGDWTRFLKEKKICVD